MPQVTLDVLKTHIAYTAWASTQLVNAASTLSEQDLQHDFGTADRTIIGTLSHILRSDRTWLTRFQGQASPATPSGLPGDLQTLRIEWPGIHQNLKTLVEGLTDDWIDQPLSYSDSKGNTHSQPIWQLIFHVVNHGTHHRGQVAGFIRALGHTPPPLDLVFFYRQVQR